MLVRLSAKQKNPKISEEYGPIWVNTDKVCKIEQKVRFQDTGDPNGYIKRIWYDVTFDSDTVLQLDIMQFEELLSAYPQIHDASKNRKRKQAQQTLIGQMGTARWASMSEDAQHDAISDEVNRAA